MKARIGLRLWLYNGDYFDLTGGNLRLWALRFFHNRRYQGCTGLRLVQSLIMSASIMIGAHLRCPPSQRNTTAFLGRPRNPAEHKIKIQSSGEPSANSQLTQQESKEMITECVNLMENAMPKPRVQADNHIPFRPLEYRSAGQSRRSDMLTQCRPCAMTLRVAV